MTVGAKLMCFVLWVFLVITLAEGENTRGRIRPGSVSIMSVVILMMEIYLFEERCVVEFCESTHCWTNHG
jgi:hypothetical protein